MLLSYVCMYMYIYIYIYITCVYIYIYIYIHTYIHTYEDRARSCARRPLASSSAGVGRAASPRTRCLGYH